MRPMYIAYGSFLEALCFYSDQWYIFSRLNISALNFCGINDTKKIKLANIGTFKGIVE